ncbi:hypothetical protein [Halomarina litorea]|uniref:hypothetical protein n=1 Tax=Halomarina litorea TaxID=2961595 RepID=UPI0020C296A0|nr:hypothetical protein [Halomarina sp. BCD28]
MDRHVPEMALVVGVVLAVPLGVFALLAGATVGAAALALLVFYPFAGYAVSRSEDPTTVLVPDPVLYAGLGLGALLVLAGAIAGTPGTGLAVGALAAAPPVAYHARYGDSVNPLSPDRTLAAGVGLAVLALVVGFATGDLLGAGGGGGVVALTAADYHDQRGGRLDRRTERALVGGCLGGAALVAVVSVLAEQAVAGVGVAASLVALGAFLAR